MSRLKATFAPPLSKDEAPIDWSMDADAILHHIYGMQPWPCAVTELSGNSFKIFAAQKTAAKTNRTPGTILTADKHGIEVVCGGGASVLITELQAAGGKRMAAGAYLLGHPMEVG